MKTIISLRALSLLGFLLLIAPFYDSCNGHGMKKCEVPAEGEIAVCIDSTMVEEPVNEINDSIVEIPNESIKEVEEEKNCLEKAYDFVDDDNSQNAFELAYLNEGYFKNGFKDFINEIKTAFQDEDYEVFFFILKNTSFFFIIIMTTLLLIFSFLKRFKSIFKLSKINLILLIITIICIFLEGMFEEISQIKWGYYTFIVVQIGIFYLSRKALKSRLP